VYRPRQLARPGFGLRDFAKDVRVIMRSGQQQGAVPLPQDEPNGLDLPSTDFENDENHGGRMMNMQDQSFTESGSDSGILVEREWDLGRSKESKSEEDATDVELL